MSKIGETTKTQHLPQFVGYGEVEQALGVSRRTVERMVREDKFPKPVQLAPNRVGWRVDVVTAWLEDRSRGLVARAVANPSDLHPEEVTQTIQKLAAHLIEREFGEAVTPESIRLCVSRTATNDEKTSCRAELLEHLESLCGRFCHERALIIAVSLFPSLRENLCKNGGLNLGVLSDPETLRAYAIDILDDEVWAELVAAYPSADMSSLAN